MLDVEFNRWFVFLKNLIKTSKLSFLIYASDFTINLFLQTPKIYKIIKIVKDNHFSHIIFGLDQGYGHTITGPCVAHENYSGQILFIFFNQGCRLNNKHEEIFLEPRILFLRKAIRFSNDISCLLLMLTLQRIMKIIGYTGFFHYVADKDFRIANNTTYIYEDYCKIKQLQINGRFVTSNDWVKYFVKNFNFNNSLIKFNSSQIEEFKNKVESHSGIRRTICLYRREKKSGGISAVRRMGGDLSNYAELLKSLNELGFTILVVGETAKICRHFPFLVSAEKLELQKSLFDPLAVLSCDIFIGNVGGGSWLPLLSQCKIKIFLDAFPLWWQPKNSSVLFKQILSNGKLLDEHKDRPLDFWNSPDLQVLDCNASNLKRFVIKIIQQ